MSVIDDVQQANRRFAQDFRLGHLPMRPAKKLAIVACMDARLTVEPALGLRTGDAHIIRNAGGIVTEDTIRSLLISHFLLGTEEWMIVNHTDCGMLTFKEEELVAKLRARSDTTAVNRSISTRSATWRRTCGSRSRERGRTLGCRVTFRYVDSSTTFGPAG